MNHSLVMPKKRTARMIGNRAEADRLRPLFLRWIGTDRSNATALAAAGIPHAHGSAWVSDDKNLSDEYQIVVRRLLDQAGIAVSPCG